jgi:hypothetical protein
MSCTYIVYVIYAHYRRLRASTQCQILHGPPLIFGGTRYNSLMSTKSIKTTTMKMVKGSVYSLKHTGTVNLSYDLIYYPTC